MGLALSRKILAVTACSALALAVVGALALHGLRQVRVELAARDRAHADLDRLVAGRTELGSVRDALRDLAGPGGGDAEAASRRGLGGCDALEREVDEVARDGEDGKLAALRPRVHDLGVALRRVGDILRSATPSPEAQAAESARSAVLAQAIDRGLAGLIEAQRMQAAAGDDAVSATCARTVIRVVAALAAGAAVALAVPAWLSLAIGRSVDRLVRDLAACAGQTALAADQVADGAKALSSGASRTAAALQQTSSGLEQMSKLVRHDSANSSVANAMATAARRAGEHGAAAMGDLSRAIAEIKRNADQTAAIVRTIDEIAQQTNLLALNAAVEAARAGDAGRSFAVVAGEVRNLAQRASEAARSTAELIEASVRSSDNGVALSANVTTIMNDLTASSGRVDQVVGEIAGSARELAQGIDQITEAVRHMDSLTQSNAASAEAGAAVGEALAAQAAALKGLVWRLEALVRGEVSAAPRAAEPSAAPQRRATREAEVVDHIPPGAVPARRRTGD